MAGILGLAEAGKREEFLPKSALQDLCGSCSREEGSISHCTFSSKFRLSGNKYELLNLFFRGQLLPFTLSHFVFWDPGLAAIRFSSVQSLSPVQLFATPWTAACQASLSITNSQSLLKVMFIELVMPSNHLIHCCPLLLPPSILPCIRVFSNESVLLIRWPEYWSFGFSISPSNEHPRLISFSMDWLDLLAVQGILKSLHHHRNSKASILRCSAFFTVQLSHHMTTGKSIVLTRQTFVGKVTSLLFNMLSRLVIAFLPRNKLLLTSWLQSPSAVILEPPKIKSHTVSTVSPSIYHEVVGPDAMVLIF